MRARLREGTQARHRKLDDALSAYDIRTPGGLAAFLSVHEAAFSRIGPGAGVSGRVLPDLLQRLRADLVVLGAAHCAACDPAAATPARRRHPVAVDYVTLGSRLGSKVLRRRWATSPDPLVQRASAYFTAPGYLDEWRRFCDAAETAPADDADAELAVADANGIFDVFLETLS
ncbi:hypothetical protein OG2516_08863 [Oceanicola granulosus HTCC2516]|uniref:Heme oxygenase n=1 Tax=Oceanicola granulosus (strain ATCC BAA-861 / DSM 15982 / KCTC 12143 / HTCC2516) TaxID=314256 RepID=Q2CCS7_OCEGH|nr:hypothetical protein OG2516_08863 [Oceanicola granulosus HTCC2516]